MDAWVRNDRDNLDVAAILAFVLIRDFARRYDAKFRIQTAHVRNVLKQTWALGKWLLAGRLAVTVQAYMVYWIFIGF
jgi:hypothetical protein